MGDVMKNLDTVLEAQDRIMNIYSDGIKSMDENIKKFEEIDKRTKRNFEKLRSLGLSF